MQALIDAASWSAQADAGPGRGIPGAPRRMNARRSTRPRRHDRSSRPSRHRAAGAPRAEGPAQPVTWVQRGGLTTLLFLLPLLIIFGSSRGRRSSQSIVMSFQKTNLVTAPVFVGWDNFDAVFRDPLFYTAMRNTAYFAVLALIFGYPLPLLAAVLMSEMRRGQGRLQRARLPARRHPAGRLGAAVEDLLRRRPERRLQHHPRLVRHPAAAVDPEHGQAMPSLVLEATWAAAGGTHHHLPRRADRRLPPELYDAAEVDGAGIWRKIWHVTLPQLRGILFITLILQIIATAQVFLQPFLFTGGGPANSTTTILLLHLPIRVHATASAAAYGKATALSLMLAIFLAVLSWCTSGSPTDGATIDHHDSPAAEAGRAMRGSLRTPRRRRRDGDDRTSTARSSRAARAGRRGTSASGIGHRTCLLGRARGHGPAAAAVAR